MIRSTCRVLPAPIPRSHFMAPLIVVLLLVAAPMIVRAAEDPEIERRTFKLLDGYQVNLFASEKEGLTSPLAMRVRDDCVDSGEVTIESVA